MTRTKFSILALACTLAGCASNPAELRGKVDTHMADKVRSGIASGLRDFTVNSSNGGLLASALSISGALKTVGGTLTVNGVCYSACANLAAAMHATPGPNADVQSHSSHLKVGLQDGPDTAEAANLLAIAGYPRDRASGPNLRRLDGSTPAPADYWGGRGPFH